MKKILVPTDFSTCARAACDVALDIAEKTGGELFFIHFHAVQPEMVHVPVDTSRKYSTEHKETEAIVAGKLQLLVNEAEHRGIRATPVPVFNLDDSLVKYTDSFDIDLVVMGSHGVKGIRKMFIGTNTQRFIRHTSVPVLVVRQKAKTDFKKIVFAYNFEEDLITPFKTVLTFVKLWNSELDLLFINVPYNFKETSEISADIKRFMHQFPGINYKTHIYNARDEQRGIHLFLKEYGADLIVVITHGRTGFQRILSHSITESVISHEDIPVLVMNIANS